MEEKIYLRRVKETDMKLLFDWRNNELVRKNSFSMEPVEWQEHVKWFNATLVKDSVLFFIMMCNEQEVGQIRIDLEMDNTAIIDYSIAEKYRGLGYGMQILHLAETELYERFKNKYMSDGAPSLFMEFRNNFMSLTCNMTPMNSSSQWYLT